MKKVIMTAVSIWILAAPSARGAVSPWQWINPGPQGNHLHGACAVGSEIYAVGEAGSVIRYDGASWSLLAFPWEETLQGIWGTSPSSLFAVGAAPGPYNDGGIYRFDGSAWSLTEIGSYELYSVWGAADNEVFAGGDGGKIVFYDGYGWTDRSPGMGITYTYRGIWGTSASDVFAVAGPYIVHWDGSDWSLMTNVGSGAGDLRSVWGSAGNDVFAVGRGAKVFHYDGSQWSVIFDGGIDYSLDAIWGRAADEVYAFGGMYPLRALRYNGTSWNSITAPTNLEAYAAAGTGAGVFIAGENGQLLKYDGTVWLRFNRFCAQEYAGIWGSSAVDVYVIGHDPLSPVDENYRANLHFDGNAWTVFTMPSASSAIWGSSATDVFIGSEDGAIYHFDGSAWSLLTQIGYNKIYGIWGSGPGDVFTVGDAPYPFSRLCHYDGSVWTVMTSAAGSGFRSIWGSSGTDVFAGAYPGRIFHYDGVDWKLMTETGYQEWRIWGSGSENVYAVSGGYMLHYDGSSWAAVAPGLQVKHFSGIWGSDPADIFVVGGPAGSGNRVWGRVYHYDGSSWTDTGIPCVNGLQQVWGSGGNDVYVAGDRGGAILHYPGGRFPTTGSPPWINDYDGDGTSDIGIFRGSSGLWAIRGVTRAYFGGLSDTVAPGDYDGDGTTELGIFRPASGLWALRGVTRTYFGVSSDQPLPGDYDGDGTADVGIFRAGAGMWAIRGVTRVYFGRSSDTPAPGYYDGSARKGIGIFRGSSGLWAIRGVTRAYFGSSSDTVVPGDYNGDGTWEAGIFRPSSGLWAIRGVTRSYFESVSDQPVPADYSGDSMDKIGVFRDDSGLWAVQGSTRVYFGSSADTPVTR